MDLISVIGSASKVDTDNSVDINSIKSLLKHTFAEFARSEVADFLNLTAPVVVDNYFIVGDLPPDSESLIRNLSGKNYKLGKVKILHSTPPIAGIIYFRTAQANTHTYCGDFSLEPNLTEVTCNIDDTSPEKMATYQNALMNMGALDVWVENIHMKKSRAGFKLCLLVPVRDTLRFQTWILQRLPTLGIRAHPIHRLELLRETNDETGIKTWFDLEGVKQHKEEHWLWEKKFLQ